MSAVKSTYRDRHVPSRKFFSSAASDPKYGRSIKSISVALGSISVLIAANPAWADAGDTFNATVGHTEQYDSNLFRLPDNADARTALGADKKSDRIGVTSALFSLDKSYSLQHFQLTGSVVDYRYTNFSYLSFTALNYSALWQWSLTPRITGTVSTSRVETPTSYIDFKNFSTRNVQTDIVSRFDAEADLGGAWRLIGSVDHITSLQEQQAVREGDTTAQGGAVGFRYVFPSSNSASYRIRQRRGETAGLLGLSSVEPLHFDDRFHEFEGIWQLTGKTKLIARLGHLDRTYTDVAQRDFGGTTGDVNVQWDVSGKVTVNALAGRALTPYLTLDSNYIATDRIVIAPVWRATSKINVRARYEFGTRNFAGNAPSVLSYVDRRDIYRTGSLSVEWQPIRSTTVTFSLQKLNNTSNLPGNEYTSNGATLGAQFSF